MEIFCNIIIDMTTCLTKKESENVMSITNKLNNVLDGCILMLLNDKSLNLKEIMDELREYGLKDVNEGILYPVLLKLEVEGLFKIHKMDPDEGPIRKYYSLSEKGKLQLNDYQAVWSNLRIIIDNIMGVYTVYDKR